MSAIWLDAPQGLSVPEADDALRLQPGRPSGDVENFAHVLDGHEIVVTEHVSLVLPALQRCRWVRGLIGLKSCSITVGDWNQVRAMGLLAAWIETDGTHPPVVTVVRAEVAEMTHRLRALDDLADGWEGT